MDTNKNIPQEKPHILHRIMRLHSMLSYPRVTIAGRNGHTKEKAVKHEYNAFVIDCKTREGGFEYIEFTNIPTNSFSREYRGREVHLLVRDISGNIALPDIDYNKEPGGTPSDLYNVLQDKDSPQLFCKQQHPWISPITKGFFVISGVFVFFLFMIWAVNL